MDELVAKANALAARGFTVREQAAMLGMTPAAFRVAMSRRGCYYTVLCAQWQQNPAKAAKRRLRSKEAVA